MKTIELMGMEINDLNVRESLHLTGDYLKNGVLNVIYYISRDILLEAKDSEDLRNFIQETDIVLPDTKDILHAAGISSKSREKEIERNLYFKGLLRVLERDGKKIYIVADSEQKAASIRAGMDTIQKDLDIIGKYILADEADAENAVNEINGMAPDVIVSAIKSPLHESFIAEQKMKINAKLLVALTPGMLTLKEDGTLNHKGLLNRLRTGFFNKAARNYKKEN